MSEETFKSLSALVDGELSAEEGNSLIRKLCKDDELKAQWEREHRVRDAMQGQLNPMLDAGFADRVSAAIADEPVIIAPQAAPAEQPKPAPRQFNKPFAGLAIAATVAAVSMLVLQVFDGGQSPALSPAAPQLASGAPLSNPANPAVRLVSSPGTYWSAPAKAAERDVELEQRLNMYLSDHMEHATIGKVHGMLPYSRLVGYDAAK